MENLIKQTITKWASLRFSSLRSSLFLGQSFFHELLMEHRLRFWHGKSRGSSFSQFPFDRSLSINLGHKVMHNPSFNSKKFKGKRGEQERKEEGDADRTNAKTRRANFSSTTAHSSSSFLVSRKGSKRKKTSSWCVRKRLLSLFFPLFSSSF